MKEESARGEKALRGEETFWGEKAFRGEQARAVIRYVREEYGGELEFLWEDLTAAIWRNGANRKWYGLIMRVAGRRLGLATEGEVEILDLRFEKGMAREFVAERQAAEGATAGALDMGDVAAGALGMGDVAPGSGAGILLGYHMNKDNWITVVLDAGVATEEILALIDQSHRIVAAGK